MASTPQWGPKLNTDSERVTGIGFIYSSLNFQFSKTAILNYFGQETFLITLKSDSLNGGLYLNFGRKTLNQNIYVH